ncbi:MAG: alpha-amylase, partial [Actinomycetes bacterium]
MPDAAGRLDPVTDERPFARTSDPFQPAGTADAATTASPWWRDAVFYQVYVRSFADSDGDGVGDLAGVRARLPHLRDLGVD